MKSFLKKKDDVFVKERRDELKKSMPVFDEKLKVWFVNGSKHKRAVEVIQLLNNEKPVTKEGEPDRMDHYLRQLQKHDVDTKSPEAVAALYEIMGGLIRTPAEQKEADVKAAEMKKKGKKQMIELEK